MMYRSLLLIFISLLPFLSQGQSLIPYAVMNEKSDICNHVHPVKSALAESDNPLLLRHPPLHFHGVQSGQEFPAGQIPRAAEDHQRLGILDLEIRNLT